MNKLFSTLIVVLGFAAFGFSQNIANSEGTNALAASKTSGEYSFTLPSEMDDEMVAKNAAYYTAYFTVNFDNSSKVANITMVDNTPRGRSVIARFLSSSNVREIEVDGVNHTVGDFMENFLK